MRHPTDGTLRRLLDEPAGVAAADRAHVADCRTCLSALAAAREDALLVGTALQTSASSASSASFASSDVDAGWSRLSDALAEEAGAKVLPVRAQSNGVLPLRAQSVGVLPIRAQSKGRAERWRAALRSPVIAVVGVAAIVTGASAAAAGDWFPIFRAERVAPITVDPADLGKLPELDAYGDVRFIEPADVRKVPNAAAARAATGLTAPRVGELPRGVVGEPGFLVVNQVSAQFTFDARKAAAAAGGTAHPAPPAGLDGSEFRMTAGPGLAQVWNEARGVPALVVARVVAPKAYSTGVPFETARDYLLSLPGLPSSVAKQLRAFTGDGTTLPMIVNSDEEATASTDVHGVPATLLTDRGNALNGVVWIEDGVINAVGGSIGADEVLSVARGLR
ncbi:hypothetical protein AB0M54_20140 [Actinoplanes sp. NPDC051470]|uniref:hypothetical protein n=1 Tax=Actinoplanes sp. NPDC051470 TaxID=3157224 RepID=UPI003440F071